MVPQDTLNAYLLQAITTNADRAALSNLQGPALTFAQVGQRVTALHKFFKDNNIVPGDHIALCARNSAEWAVAAIAILAYGAVAVPILNDFRSDAVVNLVNHSQARLLFVDASKQKSLDAASMPGLVAIVNLDTIPELPVPADFSLENLKFADVAPDATVLINYTSGSTGNPKGVMLSERALWSNLQFCIDGLRFLHPGDTALSMLPLAHMFGFMVELIHTFAKGCHTTFLNRTPSPKILLQAFAEVRPKMIVAVPLIIEKIIRTRVLPEMRKPLMRTLLAIPGIRNLVYAQVRKKLIGVFGGEVLQVIVGGAALSAEVEDFLRRIKFPITVGYGMTECGPLIAYAPWDVNPSGACGRCVTRMEIRVDSVDPANKPGVLWVKGDNVMQGYYRNPEATAEVFEDGWMNTGDICQVDPQGFIFIRGRDKNLILGPSGQNIYPEEIEQQLNVMPYVAECLVIDGGQGKLHAIIVPDWDAAHAAGLDDDAVATTMADNIGTLNRGLEAFQHIASHELRHDEFEKTPKRSIKRFLYQR